MRVVAGSAKGRTLQAVPGDSTRPILDRVKTALFDTIRPTLPDLTVLDLFAGSGSVGIEALSQGAAHCIFLDINQRAVETIKNNLRHTGLEAKAQVLNQDAFAYLRKCKRDFGLIFIAPPQYKSLWTEAMHTIAERPQILQKEGAIIIQIDPREYEELSLNCFRESRQKKYGNSLLVWFEHSPE